MRAKILTLILLLCTLAVSANDWSRWTVYQSYSEIEQVEPAGDNIYVIALGALYSYNVNDDAIRTYTKNDGMSGNVATMVGWIAGTKTLAVVHDNYVIDLLRSNGDILPIADLANKQISGDKTVYNMYAQGQYLYVCTGFGLLKVNTREGYIADSFSLNVKVTDVMLKGCDIYVLTGNNAILKGEAGRNLYDPNNWQAYDGKWSDMKPDENLKNSFGVLYHDAQRNCYWGSNEDGKLTRYEQEGTEVVAKTTGVAPDGPKGNNVWRVYVHDGKVYCTAGNYSYGVTAELSNLPGLVQYMTDGTWQQLEAPVGKYVAANCMAFDPKDKNHYWVGALTGLYEYRDGKIVNTFTTSNSTLCPIYNTDKSRSVICSMTYDGNNNLWIGNGWCDVTLNCYSNAGEWKDYRFPGVDFASLKNVDVQGLFLSKTNGRMWWVNNIWGGLVGRYNPQDNTAMTFSSFVNEDQSRIKLNQIFDITEDKKGNVWIASDAGPFYIAASDVLNSNPVFVQHKVPRNDGTNYADYLLDGISVRNVAVDAANRKWIGTAGNGVFLISDDCNTQIEHFTTDNSPLLSDVIFDITIDEVTGEIYFATTNGLCSYKGDVTQNSDGDMTTETVYAYPNPVTPEYTGMISIVELQSNAQVKITTSSGELVHEGTCMGGAYHWNGCDMKGRRVASGVYMVTVTDADGDKGVVTKIAIVR